MSISPNSVSPNSISPIIDRRYRLTPQDLGRHDHVVTIRNVSWQGVETLSPLLHLHEFPTKRLALDAIQQQELIQILGTYHTEDWIGEQVIIAAQSDHDQLRVHLFPPTSAARNRKALLPTEIHLPDSMKATVILLLILFVLFLLVALLDQSDGFWQWLTN